MRDKVKLLICATVCATVIICGLLFWPTLNRYDKVKVGTPVKFSMIYIYGGRERYAINVRRKQEL